MLMKNNFKNDEDLTAFFHKVKDFISFEDIELKRILSCKKSRCLFFAKYIDKIIYLFGKKEMTSNNIDFDEVDFSPLKEKNISLDVLIEIMKNTEHKFKQMTETVLCHLYPEFDFFFNIRNTPWQIFRHDDNEESYQATFDIYEKIMNLPNPFDDDRFRALPLYTCKYVTKGLDRSVFLHNEKGSPYKYVDPESNEIVTKESKSGYNSFYMDGRVGIVFYFKDKPSMMISFNFDADKNIYIKQVQCQKKDRGHYKIKGDWKIAIIDYVKELFPEHKILLISGKDMVDGVLSTYDEESPLYPTKVTIDRINKLYDNLYPNNNNWIEKRYSMYKIL